MRRYSFEQFSAVQNYNDLSWSPDGTSVTYVTNVSGQFNVWRQPIATTADGLPLQPKQLTALIERAARRAAWSPDGKRILTIADQHGTENFQLFEIPADHGWLYPITNNPAARFETGDEPFSPDGQLIAYGSNERVASDFDVIVRDLSSGETRPVMAGDANYHPGPWSPDGRSLLVVKTLSNTNTDLYLCEIQTGETRHLTPHEGEARFYPQAWTPEGQGVYLLSDRDREFMGAAFFDLRTNQFDWRITPDWDVEELALAADGTLLAWIQNEDGFSRLYIADQTTGQTRDYPDLPRGVYSTLRWSPGGQKLGFYIGTARQPGNLVILDVASGAMRQLTDSFLGGIPTEAMIEPEVVRYQSADGRMIPAFLYRPHDVPAGERVPVVLSVHGGPEAQERPGYVYNGLYQYLLNRNIGVLATNIRGSTGYGKSYQKAIHRDWGGAELKDLEHAALYLQGLDWVDPARLGVFGGSFGGFATLSCVTRLPQYWAAAVDIVGPSNLVTFAKAVPPFWRRIMKSWVGDPEEDAEMLRERSPITYVDQVRAPLLVIQGANDPRVVKGESDQMVARLQELGRTVEYMVFDDEGHGFTKSANLLKAMRATADWFEQHLTGNSGN